MEGICGIARNLLLFGDGGGGGSGSGGMFKQNLADLAWAFVRICDYKNEMY